jgi:protein TonB
MPAVLGADSIGLQGAALAFSISAHAAVALLAAHGGASRGSSPPAQSPSLELVMLEAPAIENSPGPAGAEPIGPRAHHTHPYPVAADHDVTPHDPAMPHLPLPAPRVDRLSTPPVVVAMDPSAAPARFVVNVGPATRVEGGATSADAPPADSGAPSSVVAENFVDTKATLLAGRAPAYTAEAESAGVEADVPLEIVVDERGSVVSARAVRHVGYGLDEAALLGIRGYRFEPARRRGRPVSVRMRWLVRFELR